MKRIFHNIVDLEFLEGATKYVDSEIMELAELFKKEKKYSIKRHHLIGILILSRALQKLKKNTPTYILRPANYWEYMVVRIKLFFNSSYLPISFSVSLDDTWQLFFYETFGFRFVIWLNIEADKDTDTDTEIRDGFVLHVCRITDVSQNDPQICLDESIEIADKAF